MLATPPSGYMPKRGIDPLRCEIARFYKLYSTKDYVEPISMIVPRKVCLTHIHTHSHTHTHTHTHTRTLTHTQLDGFQEDIFPPTQSSCASLTVDEWLTGMNRQPILMSLKVTQGDEVTLGNVHKYLIRIPTLLSLDQILQSLSILLWIVNRL